MDNKTTGVSLGERMRIVRLAQGMSQQAVADVMTDAGFAWKQSTVWNSENDTRELKWSEGVAFSTLIGSIGDVAAGDEQLIRDAAAYQRILRVIGENEAVAS